MPEELDVIVVGGGPAGLTAALYTARRGLRTLVLSQDIGGQAATTSEIENYPGIERIDGFELMTRFKEQAEKYGALVQLEDVVGIHPAREAMFTVKTAQSSYTSRTVILAFGLTHRHLGVPGEEKLVGRGVTYCATCDAPLYSGKRVVVVGGGNSAMDAALFLSRLAAEVSLVTANKEFRGERALIDRLQATPKIEQHLNAITKGVLGEDTVTGLVLEENGHEQTILCDGIFVEIGFTVNPQLVKDILQLDQRNQIIIDQAMNGTSVPGLFAAGDVTTITQKQVVISAGEGAKAGLGAYQYLQSLGRVPKSGLVDWGVKTPIRSADPL